MKKTKLTRSLLAACSIVALSAVMYGCTSDGSKNDLIATEDALEQEKMAHAATQAALDTANGEMTRLTGELSTATGNAADLKIQLSTANTDLGTANGEVTRLTGELGTATGEVTRLTGELGTATGEVTRLTGELNTATKTIGLADDAADDSADASLHAQLNAAKGDATGLRTTIGLADDAADDSADASLHAQLNAAKANAGSADDAADDSADASLHAQLNAAKARIKELVAGTDRVVLDPIKTAASTAATEAGTASTTAGEAATEAEMADDNRATMQTGDANSVADATAARNAATAAAAATKDAADASTAAQNAANADDATPHKNAADAARDAAMEAQTAAETARDDAVADSMVELKIDGTVKSVGDTSIDAEVGSSEVTTNGNTVTTGLLPEGDQPMHMAAATPGEDGIPGKSGEPVTNPYVAPVAAGAAGREFPIGKLVDSADDTARLMIVTQHAGSKTVKVYASDGKELESASGLLLSDGRIQTAGKATPTKATDDRFVTLKPAGMYYPASGTDGKLLGELRLVAVGTGVVVSKTAKPVQVYSYSDTGEDLVNPDDDESGYVVFLEDKTTAAGETTVSYAKADIYVSLDRDLSDPNNTLNHEVTAKIPEATDYKHIHFGVWAALGDPKKDGTQELSDLGIGFVQSIGDGLTGADMPNNGFANYSGNWAAAVQAADEDDGDGDISLVHGAATIEADLSKATIEATLTGLATLEGTIDTNTFSGTKATVGGNNVHSLTAAAKFTGSFSGGFYGKQAAEAGGVFDFTSEDQEAGAFRGAFGGDRD